MGIVVLVVTAAQDHDSSSKILKPKKLGKFQVLYKLGDKT